jgi:hypothetical protein
MQEDSTREAAASTATWEGLEGFTRQKIQG